jgi:hypothetical protein
MPLKYPTDLRKFLWAEAANWATNVENCLVTANKPILSYFQFYNKPPLLPHHPFNEIGIVTNSQNSQIQAKLTNRGIPCLNLGLAANHSSDVYQMLNLKT